MRKIFKQINWVSIVYLSVVLTCMLKVGEKIGIISGGNEVFYPMVVALAFFALFSIASLIEELIVRIQDFAINLLAELLKEETDD